MCVGFGGRGVRVLAGREGGCRQAGRRGGLEQPAARAGAFWAVVGGGGGGHCIASNAWLGHRSRTACRTHAQAALHRQHLPHSITTTATRSYRLTATACVQYKDLMRDLERLLQLSCESARQLCTHMEVGGGDRRPKGGQRPHGRGRGGGARRRRSCSACWQRCAAAGAACRYAPAMRKRLCGGVTQAGRQAGSRHVGLCVRLCCP